MPVVAFGNKAARHMGEVLDGEYVTEFHVPDEDPHHDRMRNITHEDGIWPDLSAADPSWVSCPADPELETALAMHYGCPTGDPREPARVDKATKNPATGPPGSGLPGSVETVFATSIGGDPR